METNQVLEKSSNPDEIVSFDVSKDCSRADKTCTGPEVCNEMEECMTVEPASTGTPETASALADEVTQLLRCGGCVLVCYPTQKGNESGELS